MFHRVNFWDNVFIRDYSRWNSMPCMCNNNNSWMNGWLDLAKMQFAFGCFRTGMQDLAAAIRGSRQQNTQPQLMTANTFYPYVNLGDGRGGYGAVGASPYAVQSPWGNPYQSTFGGQSPFGSQEINDKMIALQTLADSYGNKCKFKPMDASYEKWLITTKDGKRIKVESVDELETTLSELFDGEVEDEESKTKVDKKPSTKTDGKETTDNEGDATPTDNDDKVDGSEKVDESEKADAPDETDVPKTTKKKQLYQVGWGKAYANFWDTKIQNSSKTNADLIAEYAGKKDTDLPGCIIAMLNRFDGLEMHYSNNKDAWNKLRQDIIAANPSIFNENGSVKAGVTTDIIKEKCDMPSRDVLLKDYSGLFAEKSSTTGAGGILYSNILFGDDKYDRGIKFSSKNFLLKNYKNGSHTNWDYDAILVINNQKLTLHKVNSSTRICSDEPWDFGEAIGTSTWVGRAKPIVKENNGKYDFVSNGNTYRLLMCDKVIYGDLKTASNGQLVLVKNGKEYNMNDLMAGRISIN